MWKIKPFIYKLHLFYIQALPGISEVGGYTRCSKFCFPCRIGNILGMSICNKLAKLFGYRNCSGVTFFTITYRIYLNKHVSNL